MDFFRFPHTPHLAWLGKERPRADKVLSPDEVQEVLTHDLTVEEKVDGANVGFSVDEQGVLCVQNRGNFIARETCHPQFKPLFRWLEPRRDALADALFPDLMLFGEWCWVVHSVRYTKLPDWFLAFDVYDRSKGEFWSAVRRDVLTHRLGLELVPKLGEGRFNLEQLQQLLSSSRLSDASAEGLYIRWDEPDRLVARAKLVRPEFVQSIEEHWTKRALQTNLLAGAT